MSTENAILVLLMTFIGIVTVVLSIQHARYKKLLAWKLLLIYFEDPEAFEEKFEKMPENLRWLREKWYKKDKRIENLEDFLRTLTELAGIKKTSARKLKEFSTTHNYPSYFIKILNEIILEKRR